MSLYYSRGPDFFKEHLKRFLRAALSLMMPERIMGNVVCFEQNITSSTNQICFLQIHTVIKCNEMHFKYTNNGQNILLINNLEYIFLFIILYFS